MTNGQAYDTLSIDSEYIKREVNIIKLSVQIKKKEMIAFLQDLRDIIESDDFDAELDFTLIRSTKSGEKEKFSTPFTLVELGFDYTDIIEQLKTLQVEEYAESLADKDDVNPPVLHVFGKMIQNKLVYIKLKIKKNRKKHILCVSFHFAQEEMKFPYAS